MRDPIYALVSRIAKPVPAVNGEFETNRIQIIACTVDDNNRQIATAEGWTPHDNGGATSPSVILSRTHYRIFYKDGRNRYEQEESEVWLKRECDLLDCAWFPAMVRRMASGEIVAFREIADAYRNHNHRDEIPVGTWQELEKAWNILASRAQRA